MNTEIIRQWNLDVYVEEFKCTQPTVAFGTLFSDMGEPVALILNRELAIEMARQFNMKILEG